MMDRKAAYILYDCMLQSKLNVERIVTRKI
jgi:hypothetical protein